ncbi:MAG: hypothetical protein ACE366_11740 [Bradymonadia bacterium]
MACCRHLFIMLLFFAFATTGCGVDDFADDGIEDGFRESLYLLTSANLDIAADNTATLNFEYRYGFGIRDDMGIEEVRWVYRLVDADARVIAEVEERMRDPQPEKTEILVEGRRTRTLQIDAGLLTPGTEYVLWFDISYRGDRLSESLHVVTEGQPFVAETDELPVNTR